MRWIPALLLLLISSCVAEPRVHPPGPELRGAQTGEFLATIHELARDGDWLVSRGYHRTDDMVVAFTNIPLSHAAVYDATRDSVIEVDSSGVHSTRLEKFLRKSHRVILIRPRWWSEERGRVAVERARALLKKRYDFAGAIGLNDPKRFYCSELAFHVYKKWQTPDDHIPRVIEPGQMYLWGRVLWDSLPRN